MGNPYAPPSGGRRPDVLPPSGEEKTPRDRTRPAPPWAAGDQPQVSSHGMPQGAPPQGPGTPHGPGTPRPPRREPDPAAVRATSRRLLHFGVLLLAAVLTSTLPLPWQAGSLVFVVAALVVGIRALVQAWRAGIRGAVLPVLGLGIASAGLVALTLLSLLVVWPQQVERQTCLASAVTISATERCEADFRRALEDRLDPGLSRPGS